MHQPRPEAGASNGRMNPVDANMGKLDSEPALARADLLAAPVAAALAALDGTRPADAVGVAEIDPALADTAAFCERYGISPDVSANCVVITGRREGQVRYAACVVLATTRADVNGVARRELDVRKASFAPADEAVAAAGGGGQRRPALQAHPAGRAARPAARRQGHRGPGPLSQARALPRPRHPGRRRSRIADRSVSAPLTTSWSWTALRCQWLAPSWAPGVGLAGVRGTGGADGSR